MAKLKRRNHSCQHPQNAHRFKRCTHVVGDPTVWPTSTLVAIAATSRCSAHASCFPPAIIIAARDLRSHARRPACTSGYVKYLCDFPSELDLFRLFILRCHNGNNNNPERDTRRHVVRGGLRGHVVQPPATAQAQPIVIDRSTRAVPRVPERLHYGVCRHHHP